MRLLTYLGSSLIILVLGACATLNEDECLTMDWAAIGFEDGASGFPAQRIGQHREACAKYDVTPDLPAYRQGREDGLKEYCRPANAYAVGVSGKEYKGVCPSGMADAFVQAYENGRYLLLLKDTVKKTNAELDAMGNALARLEHRLSDTESDLVNGDNTPDARQVLVNATREMADEIGHLHHQIQDLQVRLGREEYELALYSNTHRHR